MIVLALLAVAAANVGLTLVAPRRWLGPAQAVGSTAFLCVALVIGSIVVSSGPVEFVFLYVDALSGILIALVAVVAWLASLYAIGQVRADILALRIPERQARAFYVWFHLFVATMIGTLVTDNLGLIWAAIEATTLASAVLVGFYRSREALEAAWKYLLICTVGISFALFGVLLLYAAGSAAGHGEESLSWRALMATSASLDPQLTRLAFIFVVVGFGTKAGFAPLHTWLPDAHSQAPTPVSAMLSGVLLPCALHGIMRVHAIAVGTLGAAFPSALLIGFGVLSAAVAVPFVLVQHDLKRLLAYSSIEHVGIIAIAIGIGGELALVAGILHIVVHAIGKTLAFIAAGNLVNRFGTHEMARMRGAARALPVSGALLLVGVLAIGGAPPFGLFVSEFGILRAGFTAGYGVATTVLIACIGLIFVGILFHVGRVALGEPRPAFVRAEAWQTRVLITAPLVPLVILGLWIPPAFGEALVTAARVLAPAR
ncbi:MAG: hydrogenase 4 subunit F [Chloroflexota bacterium]|nr:MAG: hydrogenase 4 subunit F [Chloroflexota bacterium]